MTRIAELQKKYPTVPKDVIVKWEIETKGIRDNEDLGKISAWRAAGLGVYPSHDEELTLGRLRKETPWRVKDSAVLIPDAVLTRSGFGLRLRIKGRSPYTIREIGEGEVALFEGEEMVDVEIYACPPRNEPGPEVMTSKGTPVRVLVEVDNCGYEIVPVRFCQHFEDGEECKFCNFNATQEDARTAGLDRSVTIDPEETVEAFRIIGSGVRLREGYLASGSLKRSDMMASVALKFVEKLNIALPYRTHMKLCTEGMQRRELVRLRDAGLTGIRLHMEVFDERLFPLIVPGKAKHLSREGWLEAYQDAVDIFGVGNVAAKFVGGVTLQGPDGFETWQEARDSHMEGDRWMIGHGVFPAMDCLRWAPGSQFSKDPANRDKVAPTEYYLDLIVAHHAAMEEYGLYEKLNKFLYSALWRRAPYIGEMGIVKIAGDVGAWMSTVVPYEQNWIARFLDSIPSPAEN